MIKKNFSIPVLMYHHVNPEGNFINVKPQIFENQIKFLKKHGFTALNTYEFLSILNGHQLPPERSIVITFDDGWLDNWLFAFPVLRKYNMKAVIFVITSLIKESGKRPRSDEGTVSGLPSHNECMKMIEVNKSDEVMLSWDELREMEESGLIDIQSHTHTHKRWDKLFKDNDTLNKTLNQELETSRKIIQDKLNKKCNALCWPKGTYNQGYINIAKSSGYEMLFTTEKGPNTPASGPWEVKRLVIGNINTFTLRKKLFIHSNNRLSKAYLKYFSRHAYSSY